VQRSGLVEGSAPRRAHILTSAADGVTATIADIGGDVDRVFASAGVELDAVANPLNDIDLSSYCELLHQAAQQTGYSNFGLLFGETFVPSRLGPLGYLTISTPSMQTALCALCEHFPAHQGSTNLGVHTQNGDLALTYEVLDDTVDRRQDAEFSLLVFLNIFRHALGPAWAPLSVGFSHPDPGESTEHERMFDAPVCFDQHTNYLLFREGSMHEVMPTADAQLQGIMEQLLRQRALRHGEDQHRLPASCRDDIVGTVRSHITDRMEASPSLEDTARALFMSSATLYRRLRAHDIQFNELVRTARREVAIGLLRDPSLSLTEIAVRLGYSELSAFSRAFRQWTGLSPAQYRSEVRTGLPVDVNFPTGPVK
jgi:AraC-like DNA-binding protein